MVSKAPTLIGLYSPAARMGKSTVSQFLTEGLGFSLVKFASPVKEITKAFLSSMGVPSEDLEMYIEGRLKEAPLTEFGFDNISSRRIQQVVGTEAGRQHLDNNLWITIAARKVRKALDDGLRVVIDDMRFPNEYDLVKTMGGECWCIYNPHVEIQVSDHPSEGLLSNHAFNQAIINDSTIEKLQEVVSAAITRF